MADPVSLGLAVAGLLPVVTEVFTGFKKTRSYLKVAKKCERYFNGVRLGVEAQRLRFLDSLEILLQNVLQSDQKAREMVSDDKHPFWSDTDLDAQIRTYLDQDYEYCWEVIGDIREALSVLQVSLSSLEGLGRKRQKGEPIKKTWERIRKIVSFNRQTLNDEVDHLRQLNEGLEIAIRRRTRYANHSQLVPVQQTQNKRISIPTHVLDRRILALDAHDSLLSSFFCKYTSHVEHTAALAITVEETVTDIKIALFTSSRGSSKPATKLIKFRMCPGNLDDNEPPTAEQPFAEYNRSSSSPLQTLGKRKAELSGTPGAQKKGTIGSKTCVRIELSRQFRCVSISQTECACKFLFESSRGFGVLQPFAYLESYLQSHRRFYISRDISPVDDSAASSAFNQKIRDFIAEQSESTIEPLQQCRLALSLSQSVLQYYTTPWLPDKLLLSNIVVQARFTNRSEEMSLLLASKLPNKLLANTPPTADMDTVAQSDEPDAVEPHIWVDERGVYNKLLFCLGVVLLEIGHWASLSRLRAVHDQDEYATARRIARTKRPRGLGRTYQTVAEKCLKCDFGAGSDFKSVELQTAFFNDVICPLQDLVERLEKVEI